MDKGLVSGLMFVGATNNLDNITTNFKCGYYNSDAISGIYIHLSSTGSIVQLLFEFNAYRIMFRVYNQVELIWSTWKVLFMG
mgnify:CR=1 FL=1